MKNLSISLKCLTLIYIIAFLPECIYGKSGNMKVETKVLPGVTVLTVTRPLLVEKEQNEMLTFKIESSFPEKAGSLEKIKIVFSESSAVKEISSLAAYYDYSVPASDSLFGKSDNPGRETDISGNYELKAGSNVFNLQVALKPEALLISTLNG